MPDKNKMLVKNGGSSFWLFALLSSRSLLFAAFQALIALVLFSWNESVKYWMMTATFTNLVSLFLLIRLMRNEGKKFFDLLHFNKKTWKKDLMIFAGLMVVLFPLVLGPNILLSQTFWNDPMIPYQILFQPVPIIITSVMLIVFPVSIALAELTTYFGYIMPRLENKVKRKWLALVFPVFFLSVQHCTLPLVFDPIFIFYRGLMFLPMALLIGITIWKRPRLLPYFVILHGLMDMQAVVMLLIVSK